MAVYLVSKPKLRLLSYAFPSELMKTKACRCQPYKIFLPAARKANSQFANNLCTCSDIWRFDD